MKPSEILDAILGIDREIVELKAKISPITARIEVLGSARADVRTFLDRGEPWEKIVERLEIVEAGIIPDAPADAPHGVKADGTPKRRPGRQPKVEPLVSPLTPEMRERFERALANGPTTAYALSKMSWAHGFDIVGLLCEMSDLFIRWVDPGLQKYELWGLPSQFDSVVGMLTLQCAKLERPKCTVAALGCSLDAAIAAWARLDLGGAS